MTEQEVIAERNKIARDTSLFIQKHYNNTTKVWSEDGVVPGSPEFVEACRRTIRMFKQAHRAVGEKFLAENGSPEEQAKYKPLVERRKSGAIEPLVDGDYFSFTSPTTTISCACTDEELAEEYYGARATERDIANARELHNQEIETYWGEEGGDTSITLPSCGRQKTTITKHPSHSKGNWDCKACLNKGAEVNSSNDVTSALATGKALDWCPNFLKPFRHVSLANYKAMFGGNSSSCYAGLLHSEMSFRETDGKSFVDITAKCDSCNYIAVESKEYFVPQVVEDNDVLMLLPGEANADSNGSGTSESRISGTINE